MTDCQTRSDGDRIKLDELLADLTETDRLGLSVAGGIRATVADDGSGRTDER